MLGIYRPAAIGAFVSVKDDSALNALDVSALTLGTFAYVVDDDAYFQLATDEADAPAWKPVTLGGATEHTTTLGSASDTLSVTGVGGNADKVYRIDGFLTIAAGGTIDIQPNGQTAGRRKYAWDFTAGLAAGNTDWVIASFAGDPYSFTAGQTVRVFGHLYARSGMPRELDLRCHVLGAPYDNVVFVLQGTWSDTSADITHLDFVNSSGSGGFAAGSTVTLTKA